MKKPLPVNYYPSEEIPGVEIKKAKRINHLAFFKVLV
jgi:hypothetical protein